MFGPLHEINPLRLDWIDDVAGGLAGKRVLDVGCGGGILPRRWRARARDVLGIDLSREGARRRDAAQARIGHRRSTTALVAAEALAPRNARRVRHRHLHGDARARARSGVDRRGVRAARRSRADAGVRRRSTATRSRTRSRSSAPSTCCDLLPRGTHDWAQFMRPAELAALRARRRASTSTRPDRHGLQPADPDVTASRPMTSTSTTSRRIASLVMAMTPRRGRCRSTRCCSTSTARSPIPAGDLALARQPRAHASAACVPVPVDDVAPVRVVRRARAAASRHGHRRPSTPSSPRCATRSSRTTRAAWRRRRSCSPASTQLLDTLEARGLAWGIVTNKASRFTMPVVDRAEARPARGDRS